MDVLLPFALILVAFYFLIIRPQRSRARAAEQLQAQLAPGVEIMTTSGIFGTVSGIEDDKVRLEISPGVTVTIVKAAVGRILTDAGAAAVNPETETAEETTGESPAETGADEPGTPDTPDAGRRETPGE